MLCWLGYYGKDVSVSFSVMPLVMCRGFRCERRCIMILADIFNAPSRRQAEEQLKFYVTKYDRTTPKLSKWMEENLPEGLTVFVLPDSHRKMMRTTNFISTKNLQKRLLNRCFARKLYFSSLPSRSHLYLRHR